MLASANLFAQNAGDGSTKKDNCFIFGTVIQQQNEKCYGNTTGSVAIFATGSTGPYTFSWSPAVTLTQNDDSLDGATGLAAGSYTITITTPSCTGTMTVTITQPPAITATNTKVVDDLCYGATMGKAILSVNGGTPYKSGSPYAYRWTPNVSTTDSATNLAAGTYIVTITDTNKCSTKDTVTITQGAKINTVTNVVPSSCTTSNGSVGVTASNGVGSYTYLWTPGGNTTDSITGLAAGSYSCTVTDANGCFVSTSATVTDSTTLKAITTTQANEKCNGNAIGTANIHVTGGSGAVTYGWAPTGGTDTIATGLAAGTYTFTATDASGCKALDLVTITQPKALRDSTTGVREVLCYGQSTGRVSVGVAGGTSPYSYAWSNGGTSANQTGLPAGPLSVIVTDANGCMDSAKITLTQPATAVADSNQVTNILCYGTSTGSATVFAYNGTPYKIQPGYTYRWSNGVTSTTATASGLAAGTYVVTISDTNRCRLHDTITITQPAPYILATDTMLSADSGCANMAWVQVVGTLSKYQFNWTPAGGSHDTAKGLCVGMYVVTVTDSNGCSLNDTINITNPAGIQQVNGTTGTVKVYPVPATSLLNVSIGNIGFIPQNIKIYDITGRNVLSQNITTGTSIITLDVSRLNEGTYFMKLNGESRYKLVKFSIAGR